MPKILIIDACYECTNRSQYGGRYGHHCLDKDKEIPKVMEIPEWCELEDALEITGIPCSHVAPDGVCERCGEEVKDA